MAEEAVIFPSQSLFMVDRSWQRRKRVKKDIHSHELVLQPSRVPEVTIKVAQTPVGAGSTSVHKSQAKGNAKESGQIQFMTYKPKERTSKQNARSKKVRHTGPAGEQTPDSDATAPIPPTTSVETRKNVLLPTQLTLPGTATALYTVIDPEVSSFQEYMSYYPTRLAASMYPISRALRLAYNPVETIWLPAVVTDEVSLHTILFSCAAHYSFGSGHQTFRDSHLLMKVILNRLNRRLRDGKYTDLTIGAVSCLALYENHLGNHQKWRMHASGMYEMIRARGGFEAVRDVLHMKIYRSDTVGAVDTLSHPHFPRPTRTRKSLHSIMALDSVSPPIPPAILNLDLTPTALNALTELSYLCHALSSAAETLVPVDPLAFDEDVTCIQHDLLRSQGPKQRVAERVCVIAALIFVQTLIREVPFTRLSSSLISRELKTACRAVEPKLLPDELVFWVLFMGGLVSVDSDEYHWFRARLMQFQRGHHDYLTWDKAKCQLRKVFWIDILQEEYGLNLWQSINAPLLPPSGPITALTDMD
ncbi:hypothetical protein Z517_05408 [Fonsecaea pedrosoi CBS 271.37]|uniref:Unplaced genomic scaffold supercont1.3, whole genome shotgun sequence n=1 Tax=Fonsecaea pedrosoi CBS 271.37 TaxID=1442368 RepID=A0A0D2DX34_9EURO|nr:uncharacterized protein Z517_05408 [Fonsecaea pedrosoi CBS 271.37]KIW82381.1 hypothetical protein Z517_05408 [Fonsecaea pedrosoi CBS 271.37]